MAVKILQRAGESEMVPGTNVTVKGACGYQIVTVYWDGAGGSATCTGSCRTLKRAGGSEIVAEYK